MKIVENNRDNRQKFAEAFSSLSLSLKKILGDISTAKDRKLFTENIHTYSVEQSCSLLIS